MYVQCTLHYTITVGVLWFFAAHFLLLVTHIFFIQTSMKKVNTARQNHGNNLGMSAKISGCKVVKML